ncbi:MAG TPA: gluconate 2-dehydrogenase subunit 3 family protein [Noviherbaspirillum sp.]|nr:gluconate 2-dehydrogenase subunit 3 family protein [Noviherbaspirillum sp.]
MTMTPLTTDDIYVLNFCAKYLARSRGGNSEAWRFPLIDSYSEKPGEPASVELNAVTFVFDGRGRGIGNVSVIGTFSSVQEPVPLKPVKFLDEDTGFFAATMAVPTKRLYRYRFLVDGQSELDAINPQRQRQDDGVMWSQFFTHYYAQPITLQSWERALLARLVTHVLPFRTKEGENFLKRHVHSIEEDARDRLVPYAYRLDVSVGVVNFIDALLAREESFRLPDYRICLRQIDRILRARAPEVAPAMAGADMYRELYEQMGSSGDSGGPPVPGWNYKEYESPSYFLKILRRHTLTGAFAHPKYGGNAGASAWAYLEERFRTPQGGTLFDWRRAIERPWGSSQEYLG